MQIIYKKVVALSFWILFVYEVMIILASKAWSADPYLLFFMFYKKRPPTLC